MVELKLMYQPQHFSVAFPFYRTIVELKPFSQLQVIGDYIPFIVPLWNWNDSIDIQDGAESKTFYRILVEWNSQFY